MARLITEKQLAEIINDLRQQPGCIAAESYDYASDIASQAIIEKLSDLPRIEEPE